VHQGCAFGIRQIVDMAPRALSPSVNDTTTAVMCVDYLTEILARLASRGIFSTHRYEEAELRIMRAARKGEPSHFETRDLTEPVKINRRESRGGLRWRVRLKINSKNVGKRLWRQHYDKHTTTTTL